MASNTSATMTNKTAIITGGSLGLGRFNCTETEKKSMNDAITPFILAVPQADLEDLNRRIDQTRWPDAETVDDWTQGAPLAKVKALVDSLASPLRLAPLRGDAEQLEPV